MRLIASTGFSRLSSHTQQISRPYIIQQLQLRGQLRNWSSTQLPSRFQSASCNHVRRNVRFHSTEASPDAPRPLTNRNENSTIDQNQYDADTIAARKALSPAYQLWITCKKCLERSSHTISKQAYHFGSCVVQCPKCKNQHLISDNLKIFSDTNATMEDIAKQHGEKLRKGRLGADGDIEFYDVEAPGKDT